MMDDPHKKPVINLILLLVLNEVKYERIPFITVESMNKHKIIIISAGGRSFSFFLNIKNNIKADAKKPI